MHWCRSQFQDRPSGSKEPEQEEKNSKREAGNKFETFIDTASHAVGVASDKEAYKRIMWGERFAPTMRGNLAVHSKKVEELSKWLHLALLGRLGEAPIALITGPPGSGKTTTLKVVATDLGARIREWENPSPSHKLENPMASSGVEIFGFNQVKKFESFLFRAGRYSDILQTSPNQHLKKWILLAEEFPNAYIRDPSLLTLTLHFRSVHNTNMRKALWRIVHLAKGEQPDISIKAARNAICRAIEARTGDVRNCCNFMQYYLLGTPDSGVTLPLDHLTEVASAGENVNEAGASSSTGEGSRPESATSGTEMPAKRGKGKLRPGQRGKRSYMSTERSKRKQETGLAEVDGGSRPESATSGTEMPAKRGKGKLRPGQRGKRSYMSTERSKRKQETGLAEVDGGSGPSLPLEEPNDVSTEIESGCVCGVSSATGEASEKLMFTERSVPAETGRGEIGIHQGGGASTSNGSGLLSSQETNVEVVDEFVDVVSFSTPERNAFPAGGGPIETYLKRDRCSASNVSEEKPQEISDKQHTQEKARWVVGRFGSVNGASTSDGRGGSVGNISLPSVGQGENSQISIPLQRIRSSTWKEIERRHTGKGSSTSDGRGGSPLVNLSDDGQEMPSFPMAEILPQSVGRQRSEKRTQAPSTVTSGGRDQPTDLFSCVGKVLYSNNSDASGASAQRENSSSDPEAIASRMSAVPNVFHRMLTENYAGIITNVRYMSTASNVLSQTDVMMANNLEGDMAPYTNYSMDVSILGLMNLPANQENRQFLPLRGSRVNEVVISVKEQLKICRDLFPDTFLQPRTFLTEVYPFLVHMDVAALTVEQKKFINEIAQLTSKRSTNYRCTYFDDDEDDINLVGVHVLHVPRDDEYELPVVKTEDNGSQVKIEDFSDSSEN